MAEAVEKVVSIEPDLVIKKPVKNELSSLLRSHPKGSRSELLEKKYGIKLKMTATLDAISKQIEKHENSKEIISDLVEIKECASKVHHENFIELCRKYGMENLDYQVPVKEAVTRCLIEMPEQFKTIEVLATVNAQRNFEVLKGKDIEDEVQLQEGHGEQLKEVMQSYLEQERQYIVNIEQVGFEVILTAHIEQRRRTITTISSGSSITDITVTPASKVVAKYDTKTNKIHMRGGNQKKLKDCILQTMGQVLFSDNNHFYTEQNKSYSLESLVSEGYEMNIDEELQEKVASARIVEQTIIVPHQNESVILTVKSRDTEQFLIYLSNGELDLSKQKRKSVTIDIVLKDKMAASQKEEGDKVISIPKTVRVTVTDDSKISYNPKYNAIVATCLAKWGIKLGV